MGTEEIAVKAVTLKAVTPKAMRVVVVAWMELGIAAMEIDSEEALVPTMAPAAVLRQLVAPQTADAEAAQPARSASPCCLDHGSFLANGVWTLPPLEH